MTKTDLIIIGSGPAGCTAAIYAARSGIKPLLLTGTVPGGQLLMTHEIENFPGFPEPLSGAELMERMLAQCRRLGVEVSSDNAVNILLTDKPFKLTTSNGEIYSPKAVIIATGARARWLGLESERKFIGKGVSACATCDGFFYRGKEVCVVGGGDTAIGDALFLTRFVSKVTVIHRRDNLRAAARLASVAKTNPKISFVWDSVVENIQGEDSVNSVTVKNVKTGAASEIACSGVFVAVGHSPETGLFAGQLDLDPEGYIIADPKCRTSISGVFAAGDVAAGSHKQAISAAGAGCVAALEAEKYLNSLI